MKPRSHRVVRCWAGLAAGIAACAACTTSSGPAPVAGCSENRSTSEIVPYIPPTCDGGVDAGTCADDFPTDDGGAGPAVSPISSPFCARHCARLPMLVFGGCSFRSTNQLASGGTVTCIPVGCD